MGKSTQGKCTHMYSLQVLLDSKMDPNINFLFTFNIL